MEDEDDQPADAYVCDSLDEIEREEEEAKQQLEEARRADIEYMYSRLPAECFKRRG